MAEKDTLKEKVAKHFKSASNANQKAIKGKARHEFNAVSGANLKKVKGKAKNAFNVAAKTQEKQSEGGGDGKIDNSEESSKAKGQEGPMNYRRTMTQATKKQKGKEIHEKAISPKIKPPSYDPSP